MSTFHSQAPSGDTVAGLVRSAWRYKVLIMAAVLLGALLGYGWAARQPTLYQGTAQVAINACPLPASCPIGTSGADRVNRAQQLMTSPAVLDRAVTMSGSRVSAEKLAQRLKVEAVQNTNVITVRVVDSTATGAAQLADSVILASDQVVARQQARKVAEQLRSMEARCELENTLANDVVEPADRPNDDHLRNKCDAATSAQLWEARRRLLLQMDAAEFNLLQRAAVPKQPIQPRPGRPMAVGMLFGLLLSLVLVWWRTRRQGPTPRSSAPELPSPA
jgi:uncharacterized protein involved in exopolysaccharide biosynthesis